MVGHGAIAMLTYQAVPQRDRMIFADHFPDQLFEGDTGFPSQFLPGLRGIAKQCLDFGRPEIARVDGDYTLPVLVKAALVHSRPLPADMHPEFGRGYLYKLAHAELPSSGDDEIVGLR